MQTHAQAYNTHTYMYTDTHTQTHTQAYNTHTYADKHTSTYRVLFPPQQGKFPGSSKDWALDPQELEAAFSPKTKMIIINTPHNPIGKVSYA